MYHNIIPATKHLILLWALSKDLLLLFVPLLVGNFLLLMVIEYPVEPQFDAVLVQDFQEADSAANVKALEMVDAWTHSSLHWGLCYQQWLFLTSSKVENWAQKISFPLRRQQLTHSYPCHLQYNDIHVGTFCTVNMSYSKTIYVS